MTLAAFIHLATRVSSVSWTHLKDEKIAFHSSGQHGSNNFEIVKVWGLSVRMRNLVGRVPSPRSEACNKASRAYRSRPTAGGHE